MSLGWLEEKKKNIKKEKGYILSKRILFYSCKNISKKNIMLHTEDLSLP